MLQHALVTNNPKIRYHNLLGTFDGINDVFFSFIAEKVKGSARKFFELDPTESLAENLSGKCIIEFPIIFIVLKDHAYNFEIITPGNQPLFYYHL